MFAPARDGHPRFAYGVGRKVGSAVVRNRVRRRLRAAALDIARARPLPAGAYLVTVRPEAARLPYRELRRQLDQACAAATAAAAAGGAP